MLSKIVPLAIIVSDKTLSMLERNSFNFYLHSNLPSVHNIEISRERDWYSDKTTISTITISRFSSTITIHLSFLISDTHDSKVMKICD